MVPATDIIATICRCTYSTLTNWLKSKAEEVTQCKVNDDVISYFDNAQVVGRNWNVRLDSKVKLSCIPSIIDIKSNHSENIQSNSALSPHKWNNLMYTQNNMTNSKFWPLNWNQFLLNSKLLYFTIF